MDSMQRSSLRLLQLIFLVFLSTGRAGRWSWDLDQWHMFGQPSQDSLKEGAIAGSVSPDFVDGDDKDVKAHWALLVAGSSTWGNYRHQADVCHAYHVLKHGGLLPEHIIVMVYDDLADSEYNPYPGKVFNKPGGPDVYSDVKIDYRGLDVNAENFLAILKGDAARMKGIGSGRVVASGPKDRVFLFYSDHGAAGVLSMPSGPMLYADQLIGAVASKKASRGYKEMVMYIEACESGSMFEGLLNATLDVYAVTASNAVESSWGTYCPGMDPAPAGEMITCLGDLFSVSWMENAEAKDLTHESLWEQFKLVEQRTSNNFSYVMGSHVMSYGDLPIRNELAGDYEGMLNRGDASATVVAAAAAANSLSAVRPTTSVRQRDADLVHLKHLAADPSRGAAAQQAAAAQLEAEVGARRAVDAMAARVATKLLLHADSAQLLAQHMGPEVLAVIGRRAMPGDNQLGSISEIATALVETPLRPVAGTPVVRDWDCLRGMVSSWEAACGKLDQYGMHHTRFFANLCNAGISPQGLARAMNGMRC